MTTASTSPSVVSRVPERHGVAPARRTARAASRSSRVPGKVTTPIFAPARLRARRRQRPPRRSGEVQSSQASTTSTLTTSSITGLDSRVSAASRAWARIVLGHLAVDGQFETLALADRAKAGEAQAGECTHDGLPLRVQNLGLGHDVDNDPGHPVTPVRERWVRAQRSGAVSRRSAAVLHGLRTPNGTTVERALRELACPFYRPQRVTPYSRAAGSGRRSWRSGDARLWRRRWAAAQ